MSEYEVAAENGMRVRVDAVDEADAFSQAVEAEPYIWMGGAYPSAGLPIGWDGGDAHDAIALGESIDAGDYR